MCDKTEQMIRNISTITPSLIGKINKLGKVRVRKVFSSRNLIKIKNSAFIFLILFGKERKRFAIIINKGGVISSNVKKNRIKRIFFNMIREKILKDSLLKDKGFWCVCLLKSESLKIDDFKELEHEVVNSVLFLRNFLVEKL